MQRSEQSAADALYSPVRGDDPTVDRVDAAKRELSSEGIEVNGALSIDCLKPTKEFEDLTAEDPDRSFHSQLHYFETLLSYGQNQDPRVTMLMVNAYHNSNQQAHGIAFFERLLERYGEGFTDDVRAVYLSAYAILRATHAERVPLVKRIPWVLKTFQHLEESRRLTGGTHPIVRWAAGQIYAQVPFFFGKRSQAYEDLTWLVERPETEPVFGFYREVYRQLARLYERDGHQEKADHFWHHSGYQSYVPKAMFMGWFTSTNVAGASMAPEPVLEEIIPGSIFALYGFGFSDIYFVLSTDGTGLIAVDAGTQPHSLKAAHEFLLQKHPSLPTVTHVFVTHAHWDHIGGHSYFRNLNPDVIFYGRDNYQAVVDRVVRNHSYRQFRGQDFDHHWVETYAPDIAVSDVTVVEVAGTKIELVPVTGGETEDAMLVHLPDLQTVFAGDIVMPWYGEPWVNEGYPDDAVSSMDEVLSRRPKHILHGHHPLTALYGHEQLKAFRQHYCWLVDMVRVHVKNGFSAKDIIRLNLIPHGLQHQPENYLSYLAARDNVIARTADQMVGIWQEDRTGQDPQGLDALTPAEFGRMLQHYLGLTAAQAATTIRKMIANGDNELALKIAIAAEQRFGSTQVLTDLKEEAGDRLRSAIQFFDPFRFVTYTEMIGQEHLPIKGVKRIESAQAQFELGASSNPTMKPHSL
ncbi:MBL fold metallo-hydrolase [Roseibium porphyridii]|uniref:MBL fold metallo-hydrolase n=1 Tax=Roseibium porphyridii TaxID=2866279 RepID=A0ABY8F651_9HYPH|nr:MBL fold metallo-hydrolase [Roseibium sp. KMA01]WFE90968.1 MBL fold metallo-hydrolase [Roseibium sp. KMA01]